MKYLSEYRDKDTVERLLREIKKTVTKPWTLMEICGGQTHSLVKNGILDMIFPEITMVHGPGCPVCVTPVEMIDKAVSLAEQGYTICSFGDMLRVPGSEKSLLRAKASGARIQIVYSPLEAIQYARKHPEEQVIFFAVGFETTAPANALAVIIAEKQSLYNFSLLVSHVLVPPAMEGILNDQYSVIDAFLAAGHVCSVMGYDQYHPIAERHMIPIIVTGFEPVDLLKGILAAVVQLESGQYRVQNEYARVVSEKGNRKAVSLINKVFEVADRNWRGIGTIPKSGLELRKRFEQFDASKKFSLSTAVLSENNAGCQAGKILTGQIKPPDCSYFGRTLPKCHSNRKLF